MTLPQADEDDAFLAVPEWEADFLQVFVPSGIALHQAKPSVQEPCRFLAF